MLCSLPESRQDELLNVLNDIWESDTVPADWRQAWTIPIRKPGKPLVILASHRSVALISCVAKRSEPFVQARLTWTLESHRLLRNVMTGFPSRISATDSLLNFVGAVE